jgi:hypothetical protein
MKTLLLLPFALSATTSLVYAETVNCNGNLDDNYKTPVTVNIEKSKDSLVPRSNGFLSAKVTFDFGGAKQQKSSIVRRFETSQKIIYKDVLDSTSFRLEIAGKIGNLFLDQRTTFKESVKNLSCEIIGKASGQVSTCPAEDKKGELLILAAKTGSLSQVEDLLEECKANANFVNSLGCNALMSVIDPNCGSSSYSHHLSSMHESEIVEILLSKGVALEQKDPVTEETALLKAVKNNSGWVIDQLLDSGANINAQDRNGNTPLILAVLNSSYQQVKSLLRHDPDLAITNSAGKTAQQIAEDYKLQDILDIMVPEYEVVTVKMNASGKCIPGMIHIMQDEPVEIELKAGDKMLFLEAKDLNLSLMAMPNSSQKALLKPSKKGNFPYSCGIHGGSNPSSGIIMVM